MYVCMHVCIYIYIYICVDVFKPRRAVEGALPGGGSSRRLARISNQL